MEHFGVKLINRGKSFKLIRDEFALINTKPSLPYFKSLAERNAYDDEFGKHYSESWCRQYRELCLKHFDLSMDYFTTLDKTDFNNSLDLFLTHNKHFKEVKSLNDYSGVEGYYIMVLDEYKQVYIGKSEDIRKRIMRHWSITKPFDRTLFPMYAWNTSVFSVDFFRALDTTRIFAWKKRISDGTEAQLINMFPSKFCANRIGGDATNALQAAYSINERQL